MNEKQLKEEICEIGRRLYNKGFAAANDGNITVRLNDRELLCTPTMVSKGFMKPEDICKVDYEGRQLAGVRKRTSEVLLHLSVYKHRPDVQAVVHCHPPHATAFAVSGEPIPKCVLPEVEVFLGEVAIAPYETPGDQRFANTIVPFIKGSNTILLANHGTITYGPTLENAYFNSEIIDAYCRILILSRLLGRVNYFSNQKTVELLELKKKIGLTDPRHGVPDCDVCGDGVLGGLYTDDYHPEPYAFRRDFEPYVYADAPASANGSACECAQKPSANGKSTTNADTDHLVKVITEQVMAALARR